MVSIGWFRCCALLGSVAFAGPAGAYTAAGDRDFVATILLPQIGPADELYMTGVTQPVDGGRSSGASLTYNKLITDRFGIGVTIPYGFQQTAGQDTVTGWQNLTMIVQYTPVIAAEDELLLSVGFEREFGGTGAVHAGADPIGATTPLVYFGKGFGDIAADYLKPFAIVCNVGAELGDTNARPNQWTGGLALEYSLPYLTSKVDASAVPDALRNLIPMVEFSASTPISTPGQTSLLVAPGVTIAGYGWELGLEAQIPATRAAGQGLGAALQLHIALDYLLPDSIGAPLITRH